MINKIIIENNVVALTELNEFILIKLGTIPIELNDCDIVNDILGNDLILCEHKHLKTRAGDLITKGVYSADIHFVFAHNEGQVEWGDDMDIKVYNIRKIRI